MEKLKSFLLHWNQPLWAILIAFIIYLSFALINGLDSSSNNYFAYLSDAFLHGQFNLRFIPSNTHDLVFFENQWFLYWLPMPSIVLMPLVAVFGVSFSDVILTVFVGAINVGIFTLLLQKSREREIHMLDPIKQAILVFFFAFGTVHFTLTPYGKVWQLSQEISLTFMLLTYLFAISSKNWKAFLLTGIALTAAMLTRSNILFVGIWPAYYLTHTHWKLGKIHFFKLMGLACSPIILGILFIMYYNFKRFGAPLEMGIQYHQMSSFFRTDYESYGLFSLHYLPKNLYYYFVYYPMLSTTNEWMMGGSLFFLSPVFIAGFLSFHAKNRRLSVLFLWITILIVCIPLMLMMGTGWVTFGPRYSLDFIVPFLLLTAIGLENFSLRSLLLLTLISVIHYSAGTFKLSKI